MDRITTFNVGADLATLQTALSGDVPAPVREPLQAMVSRIVAGSAQHPVAVYIASSDETAPVRNYFAYLLARVLTPQIPSTIVVDCDFLRVGLSGLVPERDALGFLDLLLYGSSLGVITQETQGGVKTIGAGSFPVTKRMPFVISAFEEAAHRLVHHARCVLFVGPLDDDEGALHPLLGAVDMPVLVRELDAARPGAVDPIEEQIASEWESELLSVRLVGAAVATDQMFAELIGDDDEDDIEVAQETARHTPEPPTPPAPPAPRRAPTPPPLPVREPDLPPRAAPPPPPPPPEPARPASPSLADLADPMLSDERVTTGLRPPRVAPEPAPRRRGRAGGIVVAVFVVAIAVVAGKWFFETRTKAPAEPAGTASTSERNTQTPPPPAAVDTAASEPIQAAAPDSAAESPSTTVAAQGGSEAPGTEALGPEALGTEALGPEALGRDALGPEALGPEARRSELTDTGGKSGGTVLIDPDDIHVIQEIQANWPDQFFIHISSFRRSVEARNEVTFLENHEFPVFIVFLDLGAKGKWYRVYAGPFKSRDAALDVKKSLDDLPSVRFTRITKIEE